MSPARTPVRLVVHALCDDEHEPGTCSYPDCECPAMMRDEYVRAAMVAVLALDRAGLLKDEDDAP